MKGQKNFLILIVGIQRTTMGEEDFRGVETVVIEKTFHGKT